MKNSVTILALDPGYDRIGWAIGTLNSNCQVVAHGCIQTDKKASILLRYRQIVAEMRQLMETHQPTEVVLESLFFSTNRTTAMGVSQARGVILSCLLTNNVSVFEYTPSQLKLAVTGYGRADKRAVEKMVRLQLGLPMKDKIIDDTIDALALLITHSTSRHLKKALAV